MVIVAACLVILIWLCAFPSSIAQADQTNTCNLEGGEHKAHYNCPNVFDAIVGGDGTKVCNDGTKVCNGGCVQHSNQNSLEMAVAMILRAQGLQILGIDISQVAEELERRGRVTVQGITIWK
jgi:N-methylhydantoinase B/oxoprolinase/acetone carboxylase alpha subunit